jgi:hypothetical protein
LWLAFQEQKCGGEWSDQNHVKPFRDDKYWKLEAFIRDISRDF